jgi:hypothetical protein
MTHKLSRFLTGLITALFILTSCTQPAAPELTTPPTNAPTIAPTALPTTTPDQTPTSTPTAEEQANQRLLNDGRFTTLLDNLTQEIGRGLSDDEQAQVLALARALWLPDHLDESGWLPDPADPTIPGFDFLLSASSTLPNLPIDPDLFNPGRPSEL